MSKLSEALQRKRKGESARAMGFGARASAKDRALLLGTLRGDAEAATAALAAGLDFATVSAEDEEAAVEALGGLDGLVGARLASLATEGIEPVEKAGADFVVVEPENAAAGIVDSELGLVLEVDEAWEDEPLRAIAPLSLDAVIVREPLADFTLARRISLARVAALCGAPLIVTVQAGVSSADLAALRESGAGAIAVAEGTSADELPDLIKELEAVPLRNPRRRSEGGFPLVPSADGEGDDGDGG